MSEIYYEFQISGGTVLVSDVDYDSIRLREWFVNSDGYAVSFKSDGFFSMHRFITGAPCDIVIDHINGDRLDNRRSNLRPATFSQNMANRAGWSKTGYRGVSVHKQSGKYQAFVRKDGKNRHLGLFDEAEDAARAYDNAAWEIWGEYARLNFPRTEPAQC